MVREDAQSFTIPFSHVQLRGKAGKLLKTRFAFVPSKYLSEFDVTTMRAEALRVAAAELGADSAAYKRILTSLEAAE